MRYTYIYIYRSIPWISLCVFLPHSTLNFETPHRKHLRSFAGTPGAARSSIPAVKLSFEALVVMCNEYISHCYSTLNVWLLDIYIYVYIYAYIYMHIHTHKTLPNEAESWAARSANKRSRLQDTAVRSRAVEPSKWSVVCFHRNLYTNLHHTVVRFWGSAATLLPCLRKTYKSQCMHDLYDSK